MTERPILFNGEMVRAILDGRKTQTRRPIKPQPFFVTHTTQGIEPYWRWYPIKGQQGRFTSSWAEDYSPFGAPGDHLYVRETWRIIGWHEGMPLLIQYRADGTSLEEPGDSTYWDEDRYMQYYFDCTDDCLAAGFQSNEEGMFDMPDKDIPTRWRPSIHMPKWASRITLEVVRVWAERAQEIAPFDCEAEGVTGATLATPVHGQPYEEYRNGDGVVYPDPRAAFEALWDSIYAKKGFGWDTNPWVFACEFKVLEGV